MPRVEVPRTQKLKSSVQKAQSCQRFSVNPDVGQNIALHTSPAAVNSTFPVFAFQFHRHFLFIFLLEMKNDVSLVNSDLVMYVSPSYALGVEWALKPRITKLGLVYVYCFPCWKLLLSVLEATSFRAGRPVLLVGWIVQGCLDSLKFSPLPVDQ